jgi:hypothetical protein
MIHCNCVARVWREIITFVEYSVICNISDTRIVSVFLEKITNLKSKNNSRRNAPDVLRSVDTSQFVLCFISTLLVTVGPDLRGPGVYYSKNLATDFNHYGS